MKKIFLIAIFLCIGDVNAMFKSSCRVLSAPKEICSKYVTARTNLKECRCTPFVKDEYPISIKGHCKTEIDCLRRSLLSLGKLPEIRRKINFGYCPQTVDSLYADAFEIAGCKKNQDFIKEVTEQEEFFQDNYLTEIIEYLDVDIAILESIKENEEFEKKFSEVLYKEGLKNK